MALFDVFLNGLFVAAKYAVDDKDAIKQTAGSGDITGYTAQRRNHPDMPGA